MKKITPLPWKSNCVSILGSGGEVIAKLHGIFSQRMADGDFIVRACSKHEALVEALREIRDGDSLGCRQCECEDHSSPDCCINSDYFCPTCIAGAALEVKP